MNNLDLDPTTSALLVIDMQRYFLKPGAPAYLDPPPELVTNVVRLIDAFRKAGRPVVFTRHAHRKGAPTGQMGRWWDEKLPWDGDNDARLIKQMAPAAGEIVLTKTRYSAFEETELDLALKRQGVSTICICGVMTNLCVETSTRHAFMKDFQPVVIEDACAANSREHHEASLLNLAYGFAELVTTDDLLAHIKKRG